MSYELWEEWAQKGIKWEKWRDFFQKKEYAGRNEGVYGVE